MCYLCQAVDKNLMTNQELLRAFREVPLDTHILEVLNKLKEKGVFEEENAKYDEINNKETD